MAANEKCEHCAGVAPQFTSVADLVLHLEQAYRGKEVLYRGEACCFRTTEPGIPRLLQRGDLTFEEKSFLLDATMEFIADATDDLGEMFCQHYGLPTDLLDFTSNLDIAFFFACKDHPGHIGTLAVLDLEQAQDLDIVDLSAIWHAGAPLLVRATRQEAYAVRHRTGQAGDFKSGNYEEIEWFTFEKEEPTAPRFSRFGSLLDASDDPFVPVMVRWLDEMEQAAWQHPAYVRRMREFVHRALSN